MNESTSLLRLTDIEWRLSSYQPVSLPVPSKPWDRASVALVLAGAADDLSLCFIRRTERADDPWSGHMALPGGRSDEMDDGPMSVAIRETSEEVGLELNTDQCIGVLSDLTIGGARRIREGVLSAYVFYGGDRLPMLSPETKEVAAAYWIRLTHLWQFDNWSTIDWRHQSYPGIQYQGQMIWGLTLRVLNEFAKTVAYPLPVEAPKG